jgi:uncharacterized protein YrrD
MKKSEEVIGLAIVSLLDGEEVGRVKSLVISAKEMAVAAVVVEDGQSYRGAKVVEFKDIMGIGESALTIEQKSVVKSYEQLPNIEKLLRANVSVINTKVLSRKGQIKGAVDEISFAKDSGKLIELYAKNDSGADFIIAIEHVYTLSSGITVVMDEDEKISKPEVAETASQPVAAASPAISSTPAAEPVPEEPAISDSSEEVSSDANNAMQKFEERQKKFLLGKKANRRIATDNGTEIIGQGQEVTDEIIQKAKLAGKFVELSMSLQ